MIKYNHVLLATDFSEGANYVAKKARELATQMGAKLTILHVVEPLPGYGYAFIGSSEIETHIIDEAKKRLNQLGANIAVEENNQRIELGPTKVEITKVAEEINADLIVLGSHGRHGFARLLGSTANAVVHNAKCDVLTVRIEDKK